MSEPSPARAPSRPIKVLHVEDSADDSALVMSALRRGGFEPSCERVDTPAAFKDAVRRQAWDVIISDYSLPRYNGLTALADLKDGGQDIPFILVSGTIGETGAVNAMKAGAQDYVLKDSLGRLPLVVEREIRDAGLRQRQREMSEQLVISERMASAGMLAAGVAHEINNPLAVVAANLEFVTTMLAGLASSRAAEENATPLRERLKELDGPLLDAREALARIEGIVRDVKLFSRPQDVVRCTVDVKSVIESSIRLAGNEIRHRARLIEDYGDVQLVDSNEARLGQVVLNLLVNAAQAMPEGRASQNEIRITTSMGSGDRVVIEVSDTGGGIAKDILPRVFDPFFTTKPVGVGTGLGLSLCHRMITDLGGEIAIESEVGKGTVVRVLLPAATSAPRLAKSVRVAEEPTWRGRVLIIDDEPAIGRALARSLGSRHEVVTLTRGKEALERIAGGERFDAILSDLMMPEVTGMEIHEELTRVAPDQAKRMIFLTGGAFTERARSFLSLVTNARVDKPFDIAEVLARIAEVAGSKTGAIQMPSFIPLLAPFDVPTLNDDPSTIYGVTPDLVIGYVNRGWDEFALANGAAWAAPYALGAQMMDAVPSILRPAYALLYDQARTQRVVVEHDYECSSPTLFRRFRMLIHPCESGAFLVVHRRIVQTPHASPTAFADEAMYRDANGIITQCCHCRCVLRAHPPKEWDWVPEYVAHCPANSSHGLCPPCLDHYYPADPTRDRVHPIEP